MSLDGKIAELDQYVERILGMALKAGADEAAVAASYGLSSRVGYEKNDFNIAATSEGCGFSIKVHKDQREGAASINTLDEEQLGLTIE
ncbi:MAG: hypothetical protein HQL31_07940, partial [Planctomycetes bacterium]|nr:hypothetical protein [Planctomycetota bacterium]